jgi:hypothetical protein
MLSECFRQFGIDAVSMSSDHAPRLAKEKFEACVVRVGSHAEPILESARSSRSNSRMVIYGLGGSVKDAMRLSIPVVTAVSIAAGKENFIASSVEISSGGMSLSTTHPVNPGQSVELSFALLTLPRIWIRGNISWCKPAEKTIGIRFDQRDERRLRIKEWVESYLES